MLKISHTKLWKILIDGGMNKQDLKETAEISAASISKLDGDANITTDVLLKICTTLNCKIEDIMENYIGLIGGPAW